MNTQPLQHSFSPTDLPNGLIYLDNYIGRDNADVLVRNVDAEEWRSDLKRRVQHYGYRYDYKARQARREDYLGPLPGFLSHLANRLAKERYFVTPPDQVIVNEYLPGQGISAHVDCKPCFGETIASLSLLSGCVMRFEQRGSKARRDMYLKPTSLVVMRGSSRHNWTHAIPARKTDMVEGQRMIRARRISLTFRSMTFVE